MKNVVIYSINNCSYCEAAKALLKRLAIPFSEINISSDHEARLALVAKTGHRTMPQIFIDDTFIGGYAELKAFLDNSL